MDRANAEEFYEVYKGVVTEYTVSAASSSCPLLALLALGPSTQLSLG